MRLGKQRKDLFKSKSQLRYIKILKETPMNCLQLSYAVGLDSSTVYRQLQKLREEGYISYENKKYIVNDFFYIECEKRLDILKEKYQKEKKELDDLLKNGKNTKRYFIPR